MNPSATICIPSEVMARQVGAETVILNLVTGTYFGLDEVGGRLWELIGDGISLRDLYERMLAEFDVGRDELERDVTRLVDQLESHGLVNIQ